MLQCLSTINFIQNVAEYSQENSIISLYYQQEIDYSKRT